MAKGLAWDYPVALVNSVNPVRLEGQKTAAFEIVDFLGDAPDYHLLPVGNAGNISAYWLGYTQYADLGVATKTPGDARLPGRGRGAAGDRRAVPGPGDPGHRDPDRQPGLVEARRGRARRVRRPVRRRSPTTRSWPPSASSPSRDGVFVEPASAAGVAGLLQELAGGESYRGSTVAITVTGHGLKDTATALEGFTESGGSIVDTVVDADVDRRGRGRRPGLSVTLRRGPGPGLGPGHLGQPRARASTRSAWRSTMRDELEAEVTASGLVVEVDRRRRRRRAPRRVAPRGPLDARGLRRDGRPAAGPAARVPQRHPARPRPRLLLGRDRRRRGAGPRRWSPAATLLVDDDAAFALAARIEGHPDNVAPAFYGGFVISGREDDFYAVALAGRPADRGGRVRAADPGVDRGRPRPAARRRTRTPTRPPTPVVRRCWWPRSPASPSSCWRATRDYLHQDYRRPAMPDVARPGRRAAGRRRRGHRVGCRADGAGVHRRRRAPRRSRRAARTGWVAHHLARRPRRRAARLTVGVRERAPVLHRRRRAGVS